MSLRSHIAIAYLLAILLLQLEGCYQEEVIPDSHLSEGMARVIALDGIHAVADMSDKFLLYAIGHDSIEHFSPRVDYQHYHSISLNGIVLEKGTENEIGRIEINHPYPLIAHSKEGIDTFSLFFTPFPVAHLVTEETIRNEPKVLSWLELQYMDPEGPQSTQLFESFAGTEIRGESTRLYDKKQYGLELWANMFQQDRSVSLLGMRSAEDWFLDAMRTDDLRMRNKLAFEVWGKIAALPEEDRHRQVHPGIRLEYMELFINNRYEGIYCLGERLDQRPLRYASNQYEYGGVLYEAIDKADGSTRFEVYQSDPGNSIFWDGWEVIYPDHAVYWGPLEELRKTIVLKDDEEFAASIGSLIDLENVADHYIFINLLLAYDNIGKNNFYARYTSDSRFFIIPWDLDYTWGRRFEMLDSGPKGMAYNNLHLRLLEMEALDFQELVSERWNAYRRSVFQADSLITPVNRNFRDLRKSGAIERENKRWEDVDIDLEYEYAYICNWIEQRLLILDEHFNEEQE